MNNKTKVVTKTYSSFWATTIILAIIVGIIGALICPSAPLSGFLAGFGITAITDFILLASFIPFVGVYLYWIWAWGFVYWVLPIAFTGSNLANMTTLMWIPIIIGTIFGVILTIVTSIVAIAFIGAIIGAVIGA